MSEKTHAEIVEEMNCGPIPKHRHDREILRYYAYELNAAHKHECGNAAKLREAALAIRADILKRRSENCWYATDSDILEKIDAALAAPPRNCDRPECATLELATKTWIQEVFGPLCNNSKATMADIRTFDVWIYAPASEK